MATTKVTQMNAHENELKHNMDEKIEGVFAVLENMHDAIAIYNGEGRMTFANAIAREMYPQFDNNTTVETVHDGFVICDLDENEIPREKLPTCRVLKGETVHNECYIFKHREWTKVIEVNATPIFDDVGKLMSAVVSHHDMTLRFRNQQLIQSKNNLLREKNKELGRQAKLLDLSNEAIFAWEPSGVIVYWNKGAERMYGYENCEAVGRINVRLLKTVFPESTPNIFAILNLEGEWHGLLEHVTKNEKRLIIESRLQLITDEFGIKLVLETSRDVTERQKMEEELRESELSFRMASEASGAGVYSYDFMKKRGYYSAQYKKILGMSPEDAQVSDDEFQFMSIYPEDRERFLSAIQAANDSSSGGILEHELRIVRPDQDVRWLHVRGQTFFKAGGAEMMPYMSSGVIVDVTEGRTMADKVKQISEELTHIIESTDDFIWAVGADGEIRFCNSAARDHFGTYFGRDIALNNNIMELMPLQVAKSFSSLSNSIALGSRLQFDLRTPFGERIISYSVNPVYLDNKFFEVTVFGKDITERQNAEREIIRVNAQLEERVVERTTLLEQMVADLKNITLVLSHDLKSALRGIDMYASDLIGHENIDENARKIKMITGEILAMIEGLMKYERSSRVTLTKEDVNLKKITVSVFNELNSTDASRQGLLEFETGLPIVKADKALIRHVVMNILSNALKFAKPGSMPRIVVGCRADNNAYTFYFKDNGIGFEMAYADKIFGVFERLHSKNEYEGSGVGLTIVRNIVLRHGGRVWVESEPGIGTTVYFSLPIKAEGYDYV